MSNDTRSSPMTAEVELLPLVGTLRALPEHVQGVVQAYARANVAHAIAPLQAEIEALRAERDALRERVGQLEYSNAVNADAKAQTAKHAEEVDRLRERVKELEADAERYRWLRDREIPEWLDLWHQNPDRIDAAIDAAMEGEK